MHFVPLLEARLRFWSRPANYAWLPELRVFPVADSELLNLSHYCLIAIQLARGGPRVVAVALPGLLRSLPIAPDGSWAAPYIPLALRAMPFRFRSQFGARIVEVAKELAVPTEGSARYALYDEKGAPSSEYAAVLTLLERLARGSVRLSHASKLLIAADLLVPIASIATFHNLNLLVVSAQRLAALPKFKAVALTSDRSMGFDLAAASILSQRWLAKHAIQEDWVTTETSPLSPRHAHLDLALTGAMDEHFRLDDSSLFSFEEFAAGIHSDNE